MPLPPRALQKSAPQASSQARHSTKVAAPEHAAPDVAATLRSCLDNKTMSRRIDTQGADHDWADVVSRRLTVTRHRTRQRLRRLPDDQVLTESIGGTFDALLTRDRGDYLALGKDDPRSAYGAFKSFCRGIDLATGEKVAILRARNAKAVVDFDRERAVREAIGDVDGLVPAAKFLNRSTMVQKLFVGDLHQRVDALKSDAAKLDFAIDTVRGLHNLHKKGFAHRDIKPENLLVDAKGRGVVADLGLVTNRPDGFRGTPNYMHPNLMHKALKHRIRVAGDPPGGQSKFKYSVSEAQKHDTFAMGIVLGFVFGDGQGVQNAIASTKDAHFAYESGSTQFMNEALQDHKHRYKAEFGWQLARRVLRRPPKDSARKIARAMRNPEISEIGDLGGYLGRLQTLRSKLEPANT